MNRTGLAKCMGVAMALAVTAGFAGTASAGPRGYCDSYARDVAHRKTNGGADVLVDRRSMGNGSAPGRGSGNRGP